MKSLVLIDPDELTRALLSQSLAGQGWRVLEADNGESGYDLVLQHRPNAVLCDLRTPRRNGYKVARLIRQQPQLADTRLILTTVSRFGNDRDTAFAAGADDYLVKPILPDDLRKALSNCGEPVPAPIVPVNHVSPVTPTITGPTVIRFWGVRGSIPTPGSETSEFGGNTSCVEVRVGGQIIILDAGSGLRKLGQSLLKESKGGPLNLTLLITHTHWDHIQGFPFFIPAYLPKVNVRILGYEGAVHGLRGALFEQMESAFFPIGLHQMASHVTFEELDELSFQLASVRVRTIFANHPGICLGYRLCTPGGDVVYLPDHEAYERAEVERQKAAGIAAPAGLAYARQEDEKIVEFMRDAAVVIADSQYDATEYPTRLGWGHTCADDTVQNALRANVRQLFLFHHDPDHNDEKVSAMVTRAQEAVTAAGSSMRVDGAREGAEIILANPNC